MIFNIPYTTFRRPLPATKSSYPVSRAYPTVRVPGLQHSILFPVIADEGHTYSLSEPPNTVPDIKTIFVFFPIFHYFHTINNSRSTISAMQTKAIRIRHLVSGLQSSEIHIFP